MLDASIKGIEHLKEAWIKGNLSIENLEEHLFKVVNRQCPDYDRIKVYVKNQTVVNNADIKKWAMESVLAIITMIASVFAGVLGLESDELELCCKMLMLIVFIFVVALICICLGFLIEIPVRKQDRARQFYECCSNILEHYSSSNMTEQSCAALSELHQAEKTYVVTVKKHEE